MRVKVSESSPLIATVIRCFCCSKSTERGGTNTLSLTRKELQGVKSGLLGTRFKAVCTPSHDKTSPIFYVDQEPVRRSFTWFFVCSPESKSKSLCARRVELFCIKLFEKLKKSATKTFQILTEAYGDQTLSCHVFEWNKRFSGRRVSVDDDEPAGRPRSAITAS
ncbi:hypothetical protein TNCV_3038361 [Trichonephila clavipes]|nr:hypothetical protein TNCV_3038361 [Trichonephila clavipes]